MSQHHKPDGAETPNPGGGTVAGRAPLPIVQEGEAAKLIDPDAPIGSPGAAADREQAKERDESPKARP